MEAKSPKILSTGPYIGELGWEFFSWQPMIRQAFLFGGFDKCVVYSALGKEDLYPWAEFREVKDIPFHEAECLGWHDLPASMNDLNQLINKVGVEAQKEFGPFGPNHAFFSYNSLPQLNDPFYNRGNPDILKGKLDRLSLLSPKCPLKTEVEKLAITLCLRDRDMSSYRNWPFENWMELIDKLLKANYNVILLGKVRRIDDWFCSVPSEVFNFLNQTTINDCLAVLSLCTHLAVGGSTGLLHLASRAVVDHLTWGEEKIIYRYPETNWFGAECRVLWKDGWFTTVEEVVKNIEEYDEKRRFII